jgi:vacuolar-type H+-ATPase subunit E/Vma4
MSIEHILERIDREAGAAAEAVREKARSEAARILARCRGEADTLRGELEAKAKLRAGEEKKRRIVTEQLELRKAYLRSKREILDRVYERARARIESASGAELSSLLSDVIMANAVSGSEEIVIAEAQKPLVTDEFVRALSKRFPGGGEFTVAKETGEFAWGAVLKEGKRVVNCTLDVLFEQLTERIESRVAATLFAPEQKQNGK